MGRIATFLAAIRGEKNGQKVTDVTIDLGGGYLVNAEHFASIGDDSQALSDDYVLSVPLARSGARAAIGYLDPINEPKAQPGEKRIIARDPDTKMVIVEVWLKNTGEVIASNDNGSFTVTPDGSITGMNQNGNFRLDSSGDFIVNNVVIDPSGNITTPETIMSDKVVSDTIDATVSLLAGGKEIVAHTHPITSGSSAPGPTGPNT